jgi:hypothetical protein
MRFFSDYFFSLGEQIKILIERHYKIKSKIKISLFPFGTKNEQLTLSA